MNANDTILRVLTETQNVNPKHFETLVGERKFGSQWGKEITAEELASLPWVQLPKDQYVEGVHLPFCDYFTVQDTATMLEQIPGCEQRMELTTNLPKGDIRVLEGEHVDEVRKHELGSSKVQARPCTTAWLIVGPAQDQAGKDIEDGRMVWTSFPGELTARLPPDWDGNLDTLDLSIPYAVKGL